MINSPPTRVWWKRKEKKNSKTIKRLKDVEKRKRVLFSSGSSPQFFKRIDDKRRTDKSHIGLFPQLGCPRESAIPSCPTSPLFITSSPFPFAQTFTTYAFFFLNDLNLLYIQIIPSKTIFFPLKFHSSF